MDLNTREIATIIWLGIAAAIFSLNADIRESFRDLIRALFVRIIIIALTAAAAYITVSILLLAKFGFWQWSNLKTTLIWALTFAFVTIFDVSRIEEDDAYFRKVVRDALAGTAIVTFIAEYYTFSLIAELILVPLVTFATAMQMMASYRQEHARVGKLMGNILSGIGLMVLCYATYHTVAQFRTFATLDTLREFTIPIVLTVLFIPFAYLFATYAIYERLFIRADWVIEDPSLRRYAKIQALFAFHINHDFMRRWARAIKLERPKSKADVRRIIRELEYQKRREANPPRIPPTSGWPPHIAKNFLSDQGIKTADYHQDIIEWNAESKPVKIGSDILADTVSYFVIGDSICVKRLKLRLSANDWNDSNKADQHFYALSDLLLEKALGEDAANHLKVRIRQLEALSINADGKRITLAKERYPSGRTYYRTLSIEII